jgi:hypothetical protein
MVMAASHPRSTPGKASKAPKRSCGAATFDTATHGICINDATLVWAIMTGRKIVENRMTTLARGCYTFQLSKGAHTTNQEEIAFRAEFPEFPTPAAFATCRPLGMIRVSHTLPQQLIQGNRWAVSSYTLGNVIAEVLPFDEPGPYVRGNLGAFPLRGAQEEVQTLARSALAERRLIVTDGPRQLPPHYASPCTKSVSPKARKARTTKATKTIGKVALSARTTPGTPTGAPAERTSVALSTSVRSPTASVTSPSADIRTFLLTTASTAA